jgi:hypothetical protein
MLYTVPNSLKIANNLSANTQDGPLHQLLALHARTDDVALKCETARILVNVIRSLWIVAGKSTDSTVTMESAVEEGKKTMLQPEVMKALEDLLKAGKEAGHGLLVNEAVVAMASMCRDAAGREQNGVFSRGVSMLTYPPAHSRPCGPELPHVI